jgi:hypothetical protein
MRWTADGCLLLLGKHDTVREAEDVESQDRVDQGWVGTDGVLPMDVEWIPSRAATLMMLWQAGSRTLFGQPCRRWIIFSF